MSLLFTFTYLKKKKGNIVLGTEQEVNKYLLNGWNLHSPLHFSLIPTACNLSVCLIRNLFITYL